MTAQLGRQWIGHNVGLSPRGSRAVLTLKLQLIYSLFEVIGSEGPGELRALAGSVPSVPEMPRPKPPSQVPDDSLSCISPFRPVWPFPHNGDDQL